MCGNRNVRLSYRQGFLPGGKKRKKKKKRRQKTLEEIYDISKNLEWQEENEEMIAPCLSQHKGASNVIVR